MNIKKLFLLPLIFLAVGGLNASSLLPFNLINSGNQEAGIAFLKSSDAARKHEHISRQKQLAKVQAYKEALSTRVKTESERAQERIAAIGQQRNKLVRGSLARDISRTLASREQLATGTVEMLSTLHKIAGEHETLLKRFVGELEKDMNRDDDATLASQQFLWAQFKEFQQDIEEEKNKRTSLQEKKDLLVRDGNRLKDQHASQKSQLERAVSDTEKKVNGTDDSVIRDQYQVLLSQQQALAGEQESFCALSRELSEHREMLHTDEIALQEYVVGEKKRRLPLLKERLTFSLQDIDLARQELKNEEVQSSQIIAKLAHELKRIREDQELLERERQAIDTVQVRSDVHDAEREAIERRMQLLEQRRILLVYKHELAEAAVSQHRLQLSIIEVMQQRVVDRSGKIVAQHIAEWLTQFKQSKDRIQSFIEKLQDRAQESRLRADEHHKASGVVASKLQSESVAVQNVYRRMSGMISDLLLLDQEIFSINAQQLKQHKAMSYDVSFIVAELERDQRSLNIWQRSDKALSRDDLNRALLDARHFATYLYRATTAAFSPSNVVRELFGQAPFDYLLLIFLFVFLVFFVAGFRVLLMTIGRYVDRLLYIHQGQVWAIYLTILRSFLRFTEQHGRGIGIWLFIRLHIGFEFRHLFMGMLPIVSPYTVGLFYLCSIPFFLYMSHRLMQEIKTINQRMSFLFFTETLQDKFLLLISSVLFSSSVLLPLRRAFLYYPFSASSALPNVIYGAWTLIIPVVFLLFFSKQDVLRITPSHGHLGQLLYGVVERYYYPVFFFVMGLSILVNPYVGYSNFAVYLAICVPTSAVIVYALITTHSYIRRFSMFLFIKEDAKEEDEGEDRFEHAKLYYGLFVLATFVGLAVAAFMGIARIWGIDYTFNQLWKGLSQDWVLTIKENGEHIGFDGLLAIGLFLVGALVLSSLLNRFVLSKLFEVFRVEPGAQNTVSRITHYALMVIAVILGLHAIKLGELGNWVLIGLFAATVFGAKDLVSDFFAGFWILVERPIEPGNFIETGSLRGTVKKIAARATTIRTARNFSVVIPNRELVSKPIINWGGGYYAVGFELTITVSYHADPKEVQDLIKHVVSSNGLVLRIPAVAVRLDEFADHGLKYFVRAFISSRRVRDQWDIASDIRIELMRVFQKHKIGIPYPHLVVQHENAFGLTKEEYQEVVEDEGEQDKGAH